jgi:hypothetical protein
LRERITTVRVTLPEAAMTLTILDPRTGKRVTITLGGKKSR